MFAALKAAVMDELEKGTHTEAFADGARFALQEASRMAVPEREAVANALLPIMLAYGHDNDETTVVEAEEMADAVLLLIKGA